MLYLALEGPLGVIQQNLKKLGHTGKRGTIHVVHGHTAFDGELGLARLEETIKSVPKLRLIVVDPASKLLRLLDADKAENVGPAIEKLELIAKNHKLHLMFTVHAKKKLSDDAGDAAIGSTSFRGGTDTNIFMVKQGEQRVMSTEQRWGDSMEPTLLIHDKKTNSMHLGTTVEAEEEARIEQQILDTLCAEENPTQGELLKAVTGKNTMKLKVLEQMVSSGRIVAEKDGPAKRYRAVVIQDEATKGAA